LKYKGYVKMIRSGGGKPSQLVLQRRAILSGPTNFITLSDFRLPPPRTIAEVEHYFKKSKGACKKPTKKSGLCFQHKGGGKPAQKSKKPCKAVGNRPSPLTMGKKHPILGNVSKSMESQGKSKKSRRKKPHNSRDQAKSNTLIGRETTHGIAGREVPRTRVKMGAPQIDSASERTGRDSATQGQKRGGAISLEKIKAIRGKNKAEKSKRAKENAKGKSKIRCAQSKDGINWDKLDQRGNPAISFSPSRKKRKKMIEILDQADSHPIKQQVVEKMASEFGRIYSRYRRMLQKQKGNAPSYLLPPQERKYAAKAAEWCIRKEVTPKQVLVYWHLNIGNFAEKKMGIPPLVFLSSPANIDTVACSSLDELEDEGKPPKAVGHGFSDTRELDHRLRPALQRAGFETVLYNDRHLLTIQKTAQAVARGVRLFVGAELKEMVDWAAENLYGDEE
jgi:hypothetical protein